MGSKPPTAALRSPPTRALALATVAMCVSWRLANAQTPNTVDDFADDTDDDTAACPAVATCTGVAACRACLSALMPAMAPAWSYEEKPLDVSFFATLSEPACNASGSLQLDLVAALRDMQRNDCFNNGTGAGGCYERELDCALNATCRECLTGVYAQPHDSREALNSSACRATGTNVLTRIAEDGCDAFPQCTFWKGACSKSDSCSRCLTTLNSGDGKAAAQKCPLRTRPAQSTMFQIAISCTEASQPTCALLKEYCNQEQGCRQCFTAMGEGQTSPQRTASAYLGPDCAVLRNTFHLRRLLQTLFDSCPYTTLFVFCQARVGTAVVGFREQIAHCVLNLSSNPQCEDALIDTGIRAACQPCSSEVQENNRIVLATSLVGGISILPCFVVIVLIVAYGKDLLFVRNRVIIGLMLANIVYSSGNAIPVNTLQTEAEFCGQLALSFSAIRFGRAWWFAGKYALVGFELFILGASVWALQRGVKSLGVRREVACHAVCVLAGVAAFTGFFVRSAAISVKGYNAQTEQEVHTNAYANLNPDDDLDDDRPGLSANVRLSSARSDYDTLVQLMLQVWASLLGVAIAMWLYVRFVFWRLSKAWSTTLAESEREWDRDLWSSDQQGQRRTKRRVIELVKEGYDELARPLEPFVAVFVIFGVPAAVMATDYCQDRSQIDAYVSNDVPTISVGTCDIWCELVLALRSIATVAVYFYPREHRAELLNGRVMWRRLRARVNGWFATMTASERHESGVRFRVATMKDVRIIPRIDEDDDGDDGGGGAIGGPTQHSRQPYQLMTDNDSDSADNAEVVL